MGKKPSSVTRLPLAAVKRLKELKVEDPLVLAALERCWGATRFLEAGLSAVSARNRADLLAPSRHLEGWRAKVAQEYEDYYKAMANGYDDGQTIRELTAWLKELLVLTPDQVQELDAIRRAAKGRGIRLAKKGK